MRTEFNPETRLIQRLSRGRPAASPKTQGVGFKRELLYGFAMAASAKALTLLLTILSFVSQAGPRPLNTNAAPGSVAATNAPVKKIAEGIFQVGKVRLDQKQKNITFPATVNMHEGTVEYAIVHTSGKVHESLLKTDAEPFHIHTAMLLLGAKGGVVKTKTPEKKSSEIAGDKVAVYVVQTNAQKIPIEDLLWNSQTKARVTQGEWIYNGSRIIDQTFLAQRDGSILSTIADPDALANNPRPGRDDDDVWQVNSTNTPPVNTPVQVIFQLLKEKQK